MVHVRLKIIIMLAMMHFPSVTYGAQAYSTAVRAEYLRNFGTPKVAEKQEIKSEKQVVTEVIVKPAMPRTPDKALSELGNQFRQAMQPPAPVAIETSVAPPPPVASPKENRDNIVKKVIFPKLEVHSNLG